MKSILALALLAGASAPSFATADDPPTVSGVTVTNLFGDYWSVDGYVTDESPLDAFVILDGIVYDVTGTAPNGHFFFSLYVPSPGGTADVYAYDDAYQQSNVVGVSFLP